MMITSTTDFGSPSTAATPINPLCREFGAIEYRIEENDQLINLCKDAEFSRKEDSSSCPFEPRSNTITIKEVNDLTHLTIREIKPSISYSVPKEVILMIFNELNFRDLQSLAQTCKKFYFISKTPSLWQNKLERFFFNVAFLKPEQTTLRPDIQIKLYIAKYRNTMGPFCLFFDTIQKKIPLQIIKLKQEFEAMKKEIGEETFSEIAAQYPLYFSSDPKVINIMAVMGRIQELSSKLNPNRPYTLANTTAMKINFIKSHFNKQKTFESIIKLAETNHGTIKLITINKAQENIICLEQDEEIKLCGNAGMELREYEAGQLLNNYYNEQDLPQLNIMGNS